jgi:hypothetical protein
MDRQAHETGGRLRNGDIMQNKNGWSQDIFLGRAVCLLRGYSVTWMMSTGR